MNALNFESLSIICHISLIIKVVFHLSRSCLLLAYTAFITPQSFLPPSQAMESTFTQASTTKIKIVEVKECLHVFLGLICLSFSSLCFSFYLYFSPFVPLFIDIFVSFLTFFSHLSHLSFAVCLTTVFLILDLPSLYLSVLLSISLFFFFAFSLISQKLALLSLCLYLFLSISHYLTISLCLSALRCLSLFLCLFDSISLSFF